MISREATSYDEPQKIGTPPESPMTTVTREHPSNLNCSEQTHSDPRPHSAAGQKRKRSPSPLETQRKRPSSPIETAHDRNHLQPLPSHNGWHYSNCGFSCRLCRSSSESPLDLSVLDDNPISEHESMNPPSTPASTSSARSNKRKKYKENEIKFVGPKDAEFETAILNPCGVYLDGTGKPSNMTVEDVFGPQSTKISSRVLIHKDKKAMQGITEDFGQYIKGHYDEHTLTLICTDSIVPRDRYVYNDLKDNNNYIRAVRRDKWKPGKKSPPNHGLLYTYDWDIEPDATYAVSIRLFDAKDQRTLKTVEWQRLARGRKRRLPLFDRRVRVFGEDWQAEPRSQSNGGRFRHRALSAEANPRPVGGISRGSQALRNRHLRCAIHHLRSAHRREPIRHTHTGRRIPDRHGRSRELSSVEQRDSRLGS